ncbi:hypothetical protein [Hydrogenophaga sp. ANAO-22]|uniref:hypothetical protein n=1 Tax=Hydrogenophaga sp. ANAO-22 TaxID=3166645 RepID=UPI0036D2770E
MALNQFQLQGQPLLNSQAYSARQHAAFLDLSHLYKEFTEGLQVLLTEEGVDLYCGTHCNEYLQFYRRIDANSLNQLFLFKPDSSQGSAARGVRFV